MNAVANSADRTRAVAGERRVDYLLVGIVSALLHFVLWQWLQSPSAAAPAVRAARVIKLILLAAPPAAVTPPAVVPPRAVTPPPLPRLQPKPSAKPYRKSPAIVAPLPPPVVDPRPIPTPPPVATAPPAVTAPEPPIEPANTRATSEHNPKPVYPALARRRGWEGRVLLAVEVLVDGKPGTITLATTSGRESLDTAAIEAVRQWLFEPAQRAGRPIPSTLTLSIVFKLEK